MKKLFTRIATIATVLGASLITPTASAYSTDGFTNTVDQGDIYYVYETGDDGVTWWYECSIGYVDKNTHQALTAAHCSFDGNIAYDVSGQRIGTFHRPDDSYGDFSQDWRGVSSKDLAVINLDGNVGAGDNIYSGDEIARDEDITPGTEICIYGQNRGGTNCGEVFAKVRGNDPENLVYLGVEPVQGDSGGVTWIPGKGFVGVQTVYFNQSGWGVATRTGGELSTNSYHN